MANLKGRLDVLEAGTAPARHIAYARETGDMSALTDTELNQLITDLDAEIGTENADRIRRMSDAELEALCGGEA